MVNLQVASVFNGIFERRIRPKTRKDLQKCGGRKIGRCGVYYTRINYDRSLRQSLETRPHLSLESPSMAVSPNNLWFEMPGAGQKIVAL